MTGKKSKKLRTRGWGENKKWQVWTMKRKEKDGRGRIEMGHKREVDEYHKCLQ